MACRLALQDSGSLRYLERLLDAAPRVAYGDVVLGSEPVVLLLLPPLLPPPPHRLWLWLLLVLVKRKP